MATHDEVTQVDEIQADDSGCTVDWRWLNGLQIESVTSDLQHWRVRFTNGLTLSIQAANYQGKPFLAFDPWKAPTP
ncbi:MAG TPA: hypothetical protein VFH48_02545 [Chloroflexota bacterium]|nr:hypothetical protein [Chloroflexota bacterium]